jgi:hypothetical protein
MVVIVVGDNPSLRGQWPSPREPTCNLLSSTVKNGVLEIVQLVTAAAQVLNVQSYDMQVSI